MNVADVPGFLPALQAVCRVGGVLMAGNVGLALTSAALEAAGPHIRAEVLADIADDLASTAATIWPPEHAWPLAQMAEALDHASYEIRKALAQ